MGIAGHCICVAWLVVFATQMSTSLHIRRVYRHFVRRPCLGQCNGHQSKPWLPARRITCPKSYTLGNSVSGVLDYRNTTQLTAEPIIRSLPRYTCSAGVPRQHSTSSPTAAAPSKHIRVRPRHSTAATVDVRRLRAATDGHRGCTAGAGSHPHSTVVSGTPRPRWRSAAVREGSRNRGVTTSAGRTRRFSRGSRWAIGLPANAHGCCCAPGPYCRAAPSRRDCRSTNCFPDCRPRSPQRSSTGSDRRGTRAASTRPGRLSRPSPSLPTACPGGRHKRTHHDSVRRRRRPSWRRASGGGRRASRRRGPAGCAP